MKNAIILIACISLGVSCQKTSQPPKEEAAPAPPVKQWKFSEEDAKAVLADLNELCPDSWCEGEFDYNFTRLTCEKQNKCRLFFTAKKHEGGKPIDTHVDLSGFDKVPDIKGTGAFDEALMEALSKWEESQQ